MKVNWWHSALYDTCSLITLDKILLDHPEAKAHFGCVRAIEESFTADQLRRETADRLRAEVEWVELPGTRELGRILSSGTLSRALADVDRLVFATAVYHRLAVVTGDKQLARALHLAHLTVGNCALVLKELVTQERITVAKCETILECLAKRKEFILPGNLPQNWDTLRKYRFP